MWKFDKICGPICRPTSLKGLTLYHKCMHNNRRPWVNATFFASDRPTDVLGAEPLDDCRKFFISGDDGDLGGELIGEGADRFVGAAKQQHSSAVLLEEDESGNNLKRREDNMPDRTGARFITPSIRLRRNRDRIGPILLMRASGYQ